MDAKDGQDINLLEANWKTNTWEAKRSDHKKFIRHVKKRCRNDEKAAGIGLIVIVVKSQEEMIRLLATGRD